MATSHNLTATPAGSPPTPTATSTSSSNNNKNNTVLYLAYGSNLASSTFRGTRNIHPLSSTNVLVPSLKLTFDLPGLPYAEPCFANTHARDPGNPTTDDPAWKHGLVGVVYEVTREDYAIIINTEGGGASYADVSVRCWPLARGLRDVPGEGELVPDGGFLAHTLLAPAGRGRRGKVVLDAQPSVRYKGLLTTGADEHDLPASYRVYLDGLPAYRITQWRQGVGKVTVIAMFGPLVLGLIGLGKVLGDRHGRIPRWLGDVMTVVFKVMWAMYEVVFKPAFGDGEKTVGSEQDRGERTSLLCEKTRLRD
ncbi:hypothetical protein EJ05DRAFT_499627 [Pseudovirgaria hyperparasitica]|uniref:gamma-glutamylcyclotransferase n=1 Tax=Pseudovirgaria hyperparasitica TaxID=470096 RepID=A0A6A6W8K1_9PEZI|nr:uncharacterized protein EJ05DRAFT_499627 [Pseudovirgaria hyperparasitica]KAF2759208.1 hypothetical protein EJ05DRAFT_499627 [Pseudovirgaria hyperparasitica]